MAHQVSIQPGHGTAGRHPSREALDALAGHDDPGMFGRMFAKLDPLEVADGPLQELAEAMKDANPGDATGKFKRYPHPFPSLQIAAMAPFRDAAGHPILHSSGETASARGRPGCPVAQSRVRTRPPLRGVENHTACPSWADRSDGKNNCPMCLLSSRQSPACSDVP